MIPTHREHALPFPMRVLVTGASSGIGKAQVEAFRQVGHQVVGIDIEDADLCDHDKISLVLDQALKHLGGLDVLCNTAGALDNFMKLDELSIAEINRYIQVNLLGPMFVTQYVLDALLNQPTSRVINMCSIASLTAGGGGVAYTAAKHGLAGFTKQLAYDYARQGMRANAIAPGAIQTPMTQADFDNDNGQMAAWVAEETPNGRWAQAEEVAALTLYLASDAADYMNGAIIPLDGGWLIR